MRAPERTPAPFRRGDRVVVEEPNIAPKTGVVGAAKFSPKSGWWVEVRLDEDGITWTYPENRVRRATPLTVNELVDSFERGEWEPAGTGDLFDRLVEKLGRDPASRLWSEACIAFDRKHAPEEFEEAEA